MPTVPSSLCPRPRPASGVQCPVSSVRCERQCPRVPVRATGVRCPVRASERPSERLGVQCPTSRVRAFPLILERGWLRCPHRTAGANWATTLVEPAQGTFLYGKRLYKGSQR
jgi:hypothetical protein